MRPVSEWPSGMSRPGQMIAETWQLGAAPFIHPHSAQRKSISGPQGRRTWFCKLPEKEGTDQGHLLPQAQHLQPQETAELHRWQAERETGGGAWTMAHGR